MAEIPKEELRKEINAILEEADLSKITTKTVRLSLEKKFDTNLLSRKKEIDAIVMDFVNKKNGPASDDDSEEEEEKPAPKRKQSSDDDSASDDEPPKKTRKSKTASSRGRKKKGGSDSDNGKKSAKPKKTGKGRSGTGFTRPYKLSPQLAELMGAESLPRHEVVKKVWAIIKERNLYDPKNKQFAICDPDLLKVMGIKRFRTFGMLKYLKDHFIE